MAGTFLLSKMSLNVSSYCKNVCCLYKTQKLHNGGFQFLLILDLWGISFHAVVVFSIGKDLSFRFVLGHCVHRPVAMLYSSFGQLTIYITNRDS